MRLADLLKLLVLSAIWGSSFLFMRVSVPAFGPIPLILIRIGGAALCFSPLLFRTEIRRSLRENAGRLGVVGLLNSAVPFCLFAFASISLESGFLALINAATPLFAALVGATWLGIPLRRFQIFGLFVGMAGVAILVWGKISFKDGGAGWAILAGLAATLSYGISVHYSKRYLAKVPPVVISAGSMFSGLTLLAPLGIWLWPASNPDLLSWACALALAVVCTALAYFIFFRLLATTGATSAATVTFIVPVFAILWGTALLDETLSLRTVLGMLVTLAGTAFTIGLIPKVKTMKLRRNRAV